MPLDFPRPRAQIREIQRRQIEAAEAERDICRLCYQTDHRRRVCNQARVVACSICYKLNVFTTSCCERKNRQEITDQDHQVFRLAGFPIPRLFIDINILTKNIPALFCTGTTRSKIDYTLAQFIRGFDAFTEADWLVTADGLDVPIGIRGNLTLLNCSVENLEPGIHMVLGMDYIMRRPFRCTFDNITLDSRKNWAVPHQEFISYVYNVPRGQELRRYLTRNRVELKKSYKRSTFQAKHKWKQYFSRNDAEKLQKH